MKNYFKTALILIALVALATGTQAQSPPIEWQNTIGGVSSDAMTAVRQTPDGGYIIGGYSISNISGDKTEYVLYYDYWILKLDNSGAIEWQNTIGGNSEDFLTAISLTSDGGYILAGYSFSGISGDKTENAVGGYDYWIIKLNETGNIEWQNTIGTGSGDFAYTVEETADGGYIVGGYSYYGGSFDKTNPGYGNNDYWVIKLNSAGIAEWDVTLGGTGNDYLTSIAQTTDGGYLIGGYSDSGLSGVKSEASLGGVDYWVVKLDNIGGIEWDNTIGGAGQDYAQSAIASVDGGYLVGGYSYSGAGGDKSDPSFGSEDYWLVKINSSGNVVWDKTIGGISGDQLFSVKQDSNGNYYAGGLSYSGISGNKTMASQGAADYWVLKLNNSGTIIWQSGVGGSSDDYLYAMDITADGGLVFGGYSFSGLSGDKTEDNWGSNDFWVVKLEGNSCTAPENLTVSGLTGTNAILSWDPVPAALGYTLQFQNTATAINTRVKLGAGVTSVNVGPSKLSPGNTYIWGVRSRCDGEFSDWSESNTFSTPMRLAGDWSSMALLYPNPSAGSFQVQLPDNDGQPVEILVFDITGQLVQRQMTSGGAALTMQISLPGIYQVLIKSENYLFAEQLIIQ